MIVTVKIDKDGRFHVPKAMREELRLEPRQRFAVHVSNGELRLIPIAKEVESLEQQKSVAMHVQTVPE